MGAAPAPRAGGRSVSADAVQPVVRILVEHRSRGRRDPARHRHPRRQPAGRLSRRFQIVEATMPTNIIFVVNHPREFPCAIPGADVVSASTYLTDSTYGESVRY